MSINDKKENNSSNLLTSQSQQKDQQQKDQQQKDQQQKDQQQKDRQQQQEQKNQQQEQKNQQQEQKNQQQQEQKNQHQEQKDQQQQQEQKNQEQKDQQQISTTTATTIPNQNETLLNDDIEFDQKDSKDKEKKKKAGWIIVQYKGEHGIPQMPYTTQRLKDSFIKEGFEITVVNAEDIDVYLTKEDRKSVLVEGKIKKLPDFVLSRTGAKTDFYTLAVYRHLEKLDVPVINSSNAVETVKDKLYSLQILAQNNLPVPKTILLKHPVNVKYVVKRLGTPVIIKLLSGMQGKGVFIARTQEELQTYCDMLEAVSPSARMIFQECITPSLGKDVRVLVVGGKIVGAMKRKNEKDFRANIHRGGEGSTFKLPRNAQYLALSATRLLNLDVAGVDLLFDNEQETKFKVCEVNSSPGFEGFEKAVNLDVAGVIVSYIRIKCGFPPE